MKKLLLVTFILIFSKNLFAKEKVIAKIPEASGIVYSKTSNSLFVVNDEGSVYELSLKGKILREKKIGKYDLEAISIDEENDLLLLANEKKDELLLLEKEDFTIVKKMKIALIIKSPVFLYGG